MPVTINGTTGIVNNATDLNYTGTLTGGTGVVNLGSGQVYKDASGNVGIGTSSPLNFGGANLQVQNSTIGSVVWSNGTFIGQLLASASAEVTIGSRSNHPLRFGTNDTERMRIDTSLLVATLTAAIQELKAIVDQQAVEIAALKGASN